MCKNKIDGCYYTNGEKCLDVPCHERERTLLKEQWYLETQHPISRFKFTDDAVWREYRKQLELADKIIYYDSSKQTIRDPEQCHYCIQWTGVYCSLDGEEKNELDTCGLFEPPMIV